MKAPMRDIAVCNSNGEFQSCFVKLASDCRIDNVFIIGSDLQKIPEQNGLNLFEKIVRLTPRQNANTRGRLSQ